MKKIKNISKKTLLVVVGVLLGASFSAFAAATWQGTDWISNGSIISAQKVKDNFQYLYERVTGNTTEINNLKNRVTGNTTNITNNTTEINKLKNNSAGGDAFFEGSIYSNGRRGHAANGWQPFTQILARNFHLSGNHKDIIAEKAGWYLVNVSQTADAKDHSAVVVRLKRSGGDVEYGRISKSKDRLFFTAHVHKLLRLNAGQAIEVYTTGAHTILGGGWSNVNIVKIAD